MYDIVSLGELLIDFTESGISPAGQRLFEQNPGGAVTNLLCAASQCGAKTGFIGKVGKDMHGAFLKQAMLDAGVDMHTAAHICVGGDRPSPGALNEPGASGGGGACRWVLFLSGGGVKGWTQVIPAWWLVGWEHPSAPSSNATHTHTHAHTRTLTHTQEGDFIGTLKALQRLTEDKLDMNEETGDVLGVGEPRKIRGIGLVDFPSRCVQ